MRGDKVVDTNRHHTDAKAADNAKLARYGPYGTNLPFLLRALQ
jgi:hypothetical protein